MPTKFKRPRPASATGLLENLEPRRLLSALGFGAAIHPGRFLNNPDPTSAALLTPIYASGSPASPEPFDFDAYQHLQSSSLSLRCPGSIAVNALDHVPYAGSIGTVTLPLAFPTASTPQLSLTGSISNETLYTVIDWGDGSPQTLGSFQSISPASYSISGEHTWTQPGDFRLTAFLIVSGPRANLPWVLAQSVGIAHVEATAATDQEPATIHLPLYDPLHYVPPAFPQIKLPTNTPVDNAGNSLVYNFIVG